jgi:hypothetical protein
MYSQHEDLDICVYGRRAEGEGEASELPLLVGAKIVTDLRPYISSDSPVSSTPSPMHGSVHSSRLRRSLLKPLSMAREARVLLVAPGPAQPLPPSLSFNKPPTEATTMMSVLQHLLRLDSMSLAGSSVTVSLLGLPANPAGKLVPADVTSLSVFIRRLKSLAFLRRDEHKRVAKARARTRGTGSEGARSTSLSTSGDAVMKAIPRLGRSDARRLRRTVSSFRDLLVKHPELT